MTAPAISVLMSVHNGERFLAEAVHSVLAQTRRDFEFIVIDDGSSDRSAALLRRAAQDDARVRVQRNAVNRGLIASLNTGIALAAGRYVARMDADDICLPERLQAQAEFLDRNAAVAVVGGRVDCIDAAGRPLPSPPVLTDSRRIRSALELGDCPIVHPAAMVRADALRETGGYRAAVADAEDFDLWLRIAERHPLANLDRVVLRYRRHAQQISIRRFRQQALSNLAARASAKARRAGAPDPLDGIEGVGERTLADLGIDARAQREGVARAYLTAVQNLHRAGQADEAHALLDQMRGEIDLSTLSAHLVCDLHLLNARMAWREGARLRSAGQFLRAVEAHPAALARPVKPWIKPSCP